MSAFASLRRQQDAQDYCHPHPLDELLVKQVGCSNVNLTIKNSIYTPSSIIIGLLPSQYLVVKGIYRLEVHRGECIVNNAHKIPCGISLPVVTSASESLPTIAAPVDPDLPFKIPLGDNKILPRFSTVIELTNWHLGIEDIGGYDPLLAKLYQQIDSGYTFELVQNDNDAHSTIFYDPYTLRILDNVCRQMETVVVFGVPNSGKKTFARGLLNNIVLSGKKPVAYLDLDPGSIDGNNPGCLSLRVLRKPVVGEFFFWRPEDDDRDNIHRYYGFFSFTEKPQLYLKLCNELLAHYKKNLEYKGIPLVVKYPSWIKGCGKNLLVDFSRTLKPKKMIYMTHNNALSLENFEQDAFEETDHPDSEVLSGFQHKDYTIVRGVRRARAFTKNELLFRNKLLYFHQTSSQNFDFLKPLLHNAPVKFSFNHVSAISILNLDGGRNITIPAVLSLVEATILGIFIVKNLSQSPTNFYLSGSEFTRLDYEYIGLCMVHLVNIAENAFYIYLRDKSEITDQIEIAKTNGYSVVLARGEGQIPHVEFTTGLSGYEGPLPFVSFDQRQKLGGIWKVRRNIGRKNQG